MDRIRDVPNPMRTGPDYAIAGFGLAMLAVFVALYVFRTDLYLAIIDLWAFSPFPYPFLDLIYVGAQVECFQKGIDVYVTNPCDPLGRLHDYSPLWLRLPFLVVAKTRANTIGLAMDALFMLSLLALPRPREKFDSAIVMLCLVSPMSVFALERGNVDIEMFMLAVLAVVCLGRGLTARVTGYGAILFAGLLKFYPLVLFALLLRERPRIGVTTGIVVAGIMGGFVAIYGGEFPRMAANLPNPPIFTDSFGAGQLPEGICLLLKHKGQEEHGACALGALRTGGHVFVMVYAVLAGVLCCAVWHLVRNQDIRAAVRGLSVREEKCLLVGSLLVCGCFFAGRSVGYREVHLLLVIPGLLALVRLMPRMKLFRIASALSVFLLWYPVFQRAIYDRFWGTWPVLLYWIGRELAWWCLVATLLALVLATGLNDRRYRPGVIQ